MNIYMEWEEIDPNIFAWNDDKWEECEKKWIGDLELWISETEFSH